MKRYGLTLATIVLSLSMPLVSRDSSSKEMTDDSSSSSKNRSVTFTNEDESGVMLTITNKETGKQDTMRFSGKESLVSSLPLVGATKSMKADGGSFEISAEETSGKNPLKTGPYSLRLRSQKDTGTVRIVRTSALTGGDELVFIGNEEGDAGGAFVRQLWKNKKGGKKNGGQKRSND